VDFAFPYALMATLDKAPSGCHRPLVRACRVWSSPMRVELQQAPVVLCPGCKKPMRRGTAQPLLGRRLVDVTYSCEKCGTTTKRTIQEGEGESARRVSGRVGKRN
jgi:hypothetical protein